MRSRRPEPWRQLELAAASGVAQTQITAMLRQGDEFQKPDEARAVADALGVNYEELVAPPDTASELVALFRAELEALAADNDRLGERLRERLPEVEANLLRPDSAFHRAAQFHSPPQARRRR